jgi:hypothetical protein
LNDAGDVAFAAGGMIDLSTFASLDLQFGTVVVQAGQTARLVTYPGLEVEGYGRVRGGSLGPEGGNDVALPSIGPDGAVYCLAQLNGSGGRLLPRAATGLRIGLPLVVFGGSKPDPHRSAASSLGRVDGGGRPPGRSRSSRASPARRTRTLVFRPATGEAT